MKFKLQLIVRLAIPAFLGLALTSGYWARLQQDRLKTQASKHERNKLELSQLESDYTALSTSLTPDETPVLFEPALSEVLLGIMRIRAEHSVSVTGLSVDKKGGSGVSPMENLADKIHGTEVRTARLSLRGGYSNYEGLKTFISTLKADYPVSVVALKVENKGFDLALRVYGN